MPLIHTGLEYQMEGGRVVVGDVPNMPKVCMHVILRSQSSTSGSNILEGYQVHSRGMMDHTAPGGHSWSHVSYMTESMEHVVLHGVPVQHKGASASYENIRSIVVPQS